MLFLLSFVQHFFDVIKSWPYILFHLSVSHVESLLSQVSFVSILFIFSSCKPSLSLLAASSILCPLTPASLQIISSTSNRLEDATDPECESLFSQYVIPCNGRLSNVVPTRSPHAVHVEMLRACDCGRAQRLFLQWGDWITMLSQLSVTAQTLCHADNCSHGNRGVTTELY